MEKKIFSIFLIPLVLLLLLVQTVSATPLSPSVAAPTASKPSGLGNYVWSWDLYFKQILYWTLEWENLTASAWQPSKDLVIGTKSILNGTKFTLNFTTSQTASYRLNLTIPYTTQDRIETNRYYFHDDVAKFYFDVSDTANLTYSKIRKYENRSFSWCIVSPTLAKGFKLSIDPSAVGQSSTGTSTTVISQRKIFSNATTYPFTYLAFYSNGTDAIYAYSDDNGTTWTNGSVKVFIAGIINGYAFDVKLYTISGTQYFYTAWTNTSTGTGYLYFRRDTLGSNGHSLTTGTEYLVYSAANTFGFPLVEIGTSGTAFACIGELGLTTVSRYQVFLNPNNDGSLNWLRKTFSLGFTSFIAYGTLTRLTNDKAYVSFTNAAISYVNGSLWNTTAWMAAEQIMATGVGVASLAECGATSYLDDIYLSYINASDYTKGICFKKRDNATSTWTAEEIVSSTAEMTVPASLSVNTTTGDCYCFYPWSIDRHRVYYKIRYVNGTYGSESYISDSIDLIASYSVIPLQTMIGSYRIGVIWSTGSSPYYVRFNEFDFTPIVISKTWHSLVWWVSFITRLQRPLIWFEDLITRQVTSVIWWANLQTRAWISLTWFQELMTRQPYSIIWWQQIITRQYSDVTWWEKLLTRQSSSVLWFEQFITRQVNSIVWWQTLQLGTWTSVLWVEDFITRQAISIVWGTILGQTRPEEFAAAVIAGFILIPCLILILVVVLRRRK